jgi:tetrahydromethanopterin S-methyltransferase subunit A
MGFNSVFKRLRSSLRKGRGALPESPFVIVSPSENNKYESKELMKKLIKF